MSVPSDGDLEIGLRQGALHTIATDVLHAQVRHLPGTATGNLVRLANDLLENRDYGTVEENRIGAVKLLIALLPISLPCIRGWMQRMDDLYAYEVQFTLCCFLSDLLRFAQPDGSVAPSVRDLVRDYLMNVRSNEAYNAMMAADMLGDHWTIPDGIETLIEVARESPNQVGRKAALGALQDALRHNKVPFPCIPTVKRLIAS